MTGENWRIKKIPSEGDVRCSGPDTLVNTEWRQDNLGPSVKCGRDGVWPPQTSDGSAFFQSILFKNIIKFREKCSLKFSVKKCVVIISWIGSQVTNTVFPHQNSRDVARAKGTQGLPILLYVSIGNPSFPPWRGSHFLAQGVRKNGPDLNQWIPVAQCYHQTNSRAKSSELSTLNRTA